MVVGAGPFGAGDYCRDYPCYRASAPTARRVLRNTISFLPSFRTYGARGWALRNTNTQCSTGISATDIPHGADCCPVRGKISVENVIMVVGAGPFGAGDYCCDDPCYQASAPTARRVRCNTNFLPIFRTYGAAGSAQYAFLYRFFIFYRYFAPTARPGSTQYEYAMFYRYFAPTARRVLSNTNTQCSTDISATEIPHGADCCPVWGRISVEKRHNGCGCRPIRGGRLLP